MAIELNKQEILDFHKKGKFTTEPRAPLKTQKDLSIAYSPGVAEVCTEIAQNPKAAYDYTTKNDLVAVISNGTAVLGLGNIGALASKPVMEGKSVLFKTFADVNSIDIEVEETDVDKFVEIVKKISCSFGGINLEDIKAPECFEIERRLIEETDIPIMHDDQHGTAIISLAGVLNALEIVGKKPEDVKMVIIGAGASAISCGGLAKHAGIADITMFDSRGAITKSRTDLNQYKQGFAIDREVASLEEAMNGADIVLGLSQPKQITPEMVKSMAKDPIVFAMANPTPEILPHEVAAVRDDAIMGTGRSDYPNQVNNVLGFPFIFRGAMDVRAKHITQNMKVAAAHALAKLAKEPTPDYIEKLYGRELKFGKDYVIPTPFDRRVLEFVAPAVAQAAIADGVHQKDINIDDYRAYCKKLAEDLGQF